MVKKILLGIVLILGVFVVMAAFQSEDYLIKREIVINAQPAAIYPYLANAEKADGWMPWKEIDTQVKNHYSGPASGIGSISHWESEGQMGTGKAEVVSVVPNKSVKTLVSYSKPMHMQQDSEFILNANGAATVLTWQVSGKKPFIQRLMCTMMFMDMDKYVGGMFEKGLQKLKSMVEGK